MAVCQLCHSTGIPVLWQNTLCHIVLADEPDYPGFLRVILNAHVKEMTDLAASDRMESCVWCSPPRPRCGR
jgi:hypothetical protein